MMALTRIQPYVGLTQRHTTNILYVYIHEYLNILHIKASYKPAVTSDMNFVPLWIFRVDTTTTATSRVFKQNDMGEGKVHTGLWYT